MAEEYDGVKPQVLSREAPTTKEIAVALSAKFDEQVEWWLKHMRFRTFSPISEKSPITGELEPPELVDRIPTGGKVYLAKAGTEGRERNETSKFIRSKTVFHAKGMSADEIKYVGTYLARYDLGVYLTEHKAEFDGMEAY